LTADLSAILSAIALAAADILTKEEALAKVSSKHWKIIPRRGAESAEFQKRRRLRGRYSPGPVAFLTADLSAILSAIALAAADILTKEEALAKVSSKHWNS